MLPIYKQYIKFLKSHNINEKWLKEGYFWIDRQIIRGFTYKNNQLNKVKLLRINIDKDLNVKLKRYPNTNYNQNWITWEELYQIKKPQIQKLVNDSLNLISNNILNNERDNIVLTSGGKDSIVCTYLTKQIIKNPRLIFNNTSLDVADTYRYIKSQKDIEIINPKEGFYQWRKRINFVPTRFKRVCCGMFKEGELIEYLDDNKEFLFIMGMRNDESSRRANYKDHWKNNKWGKRNWNAILPIRKWNDLFIWLYTIHNNLYINTKYKKGYNRVGCGIACPYYTKSVWVLDKYWYNSLYNRWKNILKNDFINNNKILIMNCTLEEYYTCWNGGSLRKKPTQEVIQEFADMNDFSYDISKKYFMHKCYKCNKRIKEKDVIAMNLKLHGRNANKLFCQKHLMEMYDMTDEKWNEYIEDFKNQDCILF